MSEKNESVDIEKTVKKRKLDSSTSENAPKQYDVERVTAVRIRRHNKHFRTEFNVKWHGYDDKSWEPLENLSDKCPFLVEDFEKESRKKMLTSLGDLKYNSDVRAGVGNLPVISKTIVSNFKLPEEHIPTGTEIVQDILHERSCKDGTVLWFMRFKNDPNFYFVRQCVAEFYYPAASVYFHKYMLKKVRNKVSKEV
jgi:hypothetical protein